MILLLILFKKPIQNKLKKKTDYTYIQTLA